MNKLLVGLGNPGQKYQNTRHNVGFQAVTYIADEINAKAFTASSHAEALTARGRIAGKGFMLVKPQTYMNKSGKAVRKLADYFAVSPKNIFIIHDDIALPIGTLRVSQASGAGGHNGVKSIINALGTQKFTRLRIGISNQDDQEDIDTRSYVLGKLTAEQSKTLEDNLPTIQKAVTKWVTEGPKKTMNAVNG